MMMPDHVPQMAGDNARMVGFAYAYGSIKALIASVSRQP
jgi:D-mannonate dehydratase